MLIALRVLVAVALCVNNNNNNISGANCLLRARVSAPIFLLFWMIFLLILVNLGIFFRALRARGMKPSAARNKQVSYTDFAQPSQHVFVGLS